MVLLFLATAAAIAYGSLYPFDFQMAPLDQQAWRAFTRLDLLATTAGDRLANVVLFVPYGLLGVAALRPVPLPLRMVVLTISGLMLAAALQVAQFYLPSRSPWLGDVFWNGLGLGAGLLLGVALLSRRGLLDPATRRNPYLLLLLLDWLIYRLIPFVPTLDWQAIRDSLKPLMGHQGFTAAGWLHALTGWLIVFYGLQRYLGRNGNRFLPLLVVGGVIGAEVLVVDNAVTLDHLAAALTALLGWYLLLEHHSEPEPLLLVLLITILILQGLEPYRFRETPEAFLWIPFTGALEGNMTVNVQTMAEKIFLYGALVWLWTAVGLGRIGAALAAGGLLAALEWAQRHLVGRTAEITDPLLAVLLALALALLSQPGGRDGLSRADDPDDSVAPASPERNR